LIVLGGGMAGLPVAMKCAYPGMETALVEDDLLGGTCLNRWCIPTKTMIRSAKVANLARRSEVFGDDISIEADGSSVAERVTTSEVSLATGWRPNADGIGLEQAGVERDDRGFVELVTDAATAELLGAHVVGAQGAEIVHELVLAIDLGATADDIANTMHVHPTLPESIDSAAGGVHEPS
jgi:pyruvate/2-oxoglutarate dehydrogenase complex dihydrolipoamide dehydrogenase (E3) component